MIGIPAQRVKQARFIRVNFRRNPDPVFLFVTITAKERRAGGDCAVAFVGILVRPATAKEVLKMCKSVEECRAESVRIPRAVNGLEAWIFRSERFGTYSVRFYAPGEIFRKGTARWR